MIRTGFLSAGKMLAAVLTAAVLVSSLPGAGLADTVPVRFMNDDDAWYSYEAVFDDSVFENDCGVFQPELAKMSISMAVSAFRDWERPECKQHLGEAFLTGAGFTDIRSWDYDGAPTKDTIGMLMGRKQAGGRTVVALVPSGEYYRKEWISNLYVGDAGFGEIVRHEGFWQAAETAYARLEEYTRDIPGEWILWSTGHSRAGAVANITAALALRRGILKPEEAYVYTFASPCHTRLSGDERLSGIYRGLWNVVSPYDVIPGLLPSAWGFERFGRTLLLPDPENKEEKRRLERAAEAWSLEHFSSEWFHNDTSVLLRGMTDEMLGGLVPTPEDYAATFQDTLQMKMSESDQIGDMVNALFGNSLDDGGEEGGGGSAMQWIRLTAKAVFGMSLTEYFSMCFSHGHRPMHYIPMVMCMGFGD